MHIHGNLLSHEVVKCRIVLVVEGLRHVVVVPHVELLELLLAKTDEDMHQEETLGDKVGRRHIALWARHLLLGEQRRASTGRLNQRLNRDTGHLGSLLRLALEVGDDITSFFR